MGTGSVDMRSCSGISRYRRCLSPFSAGPAECTAKKGDRHVAHDVRRELRLSSGDEPVPLFRSRLHLELFMNR